MASLIIADSILTFKEFYTNLHNRSTDDLCLTQK